MNGSTMNKKTLIALTIVFTGACAFLFNIFYKEAKNTAITKLNEEQMIHAKQAARGIEEFFATWTRDLNSLSMMDEVIDNDAAGKRYMNLFYETHQEQIKSITRLDEKGVIIYNFPITSSIGADISDQNHIRDMLREHKPVISDVFRAVEGFDAVALHVPVFKGSQFKGTVGILINFESIAKRYLDVIKIGETGYAWVISREGTLLYSPIPGFTGKSVFESTKDYPSLTAMANDMLKGDEGTAIYTYDRIGDRNVGQIRKYAVYMPIHIGNTFWSIGVTSAEQDVLSGLISFRNKLIFVIGALFICIMVFSILGIKAWLIVREEEKRRQIEKKQQETGRRTDKLLNYAAALMAVGAAFLLYLMIIHLTGSSLPPYIMFYPAIMLVALACGLGPGLAATAAAALVVDYFVLSPIGHFGVTGSADAIGLVLFSGMGILMSIVAQLYRRLRSRLEETVAERTAELKRSNEQLKKEIDAHQQSQESLSKLNAELEQRVDQQVAEIRRTNETLEQRIAERTRELQGVNETLRTSRLAALNLMEDAVAARKQTENINEKLRENEERLSQAMGVGELGSWGLDTKSGKAWRSPRHDQIFGYPELLPEWTYKMFLDHVLPEDRNGVDEKYGRSLAKGGDWNFECRIRRSDGAIRWIWAQGKPRFNDRKEVVQLFGLVQDITERKHAEEALRESEQHLSAVFLASPTGIFVTRLSDGLFLEANEAYLNIIGYSADEVIGHTSPGLNIWVNPEDRIRVVKILHEQGRIDNHEIKFRRKSGEVVDLLYSALPLERGGEHCILGTLTDISARKQAEEALRESEERYRTLFETMLEGFCVIEVVFDAQNKPVDYRILDINPAFERQTGLHDAKGKLMRDLAPDHEAHWFEIYGKIALTGEPARFENEARALNRWFDVSAVRVGGPESRRVAILFNDITQRKRAEDALKKSHDELEMRVQERTVELDEAVSDLQKQVEQRIKAEEMTKTERQRLNDVLETLPAYVCLLTPDYYMPFANKVFREWFGYQPDKKCYEFLFGRKEPCEDCQTYQVLKTNKPQRWEWTGPNGRNYDIFDYPFTDTDGSRLILEMGIDVTEQKQAEKALRSASLYSRGLLEASLDPLVTISEDGKVTDVNRATELITGAGREELIGTDFSNYFTEQDKAREGYQQVFTDGFVTDYPLTVRHRNGQLIDVLYNAAIYKNEAGEVQGVFAAARDVTFQKQASQYARSLIESSLDPLVTISADGKITDVNEATIKATGIARDGLIGTDISNYFTEPDKAREGYQKVFAEGFVTDYPLTIRHIDGLLTDVLYNASVYRDTHGNVVGVFAAARDITERKAAEEKQGVTNSLLELFARKTSRKQYLDSTVSMVRNWSGCEFVGIRVRDFAGNIPYESYVGFDKDFLALENALHLDRDKCICIRAILEKPQKQEKHLVTSGGSFYSNDSLAFLNELSDEEKKEYRGNCMKRGFQSIAVVPIRYRGEVLGAVHVADLKKDMVELAKIHFIESTIAPLIGEAIHRFNAEAELEKYRLHLEDLVKQRTEELARSNKDLEQFAYVASHDLQEPLRAVAGFVELLRRRLQDTLDDKAKGYMEFSIDGVKRMQALISGLLEYSRIGTKGKSAQKIDSKAALDEAIARLQATIKESGAKITVDELPTVSFDELQFTQLFQNLIGNAIKFRGEQPPRVHIGAVRTDDQWKFSVADNGIGIEPQYAEKIFLIFQRLHSREKYPGTGIGLAICKKIVERHGGKIWMESQPGEGSTFYFTVPDTREA